MKYSFYLILVLLLFFCDYSATAQSRWEVKVGKTNRKEACDSFSFDYDNGIIISASIYPSSGYGSGLIIKTDVNGNVLWEKKFTDNTQFFAIKNTISYQNYGYLISGYYQINDNNEGPILIKLDSCGNKDWCNYYMSEDFDYGVYQDIIVLDDSRILALSEMHEENGDQKVFLFCFSSEGEMLWKKEYAKRQSYPEIYRPTVCKFYNFNDSYIIAGDCYWAYEDHKLNWLTSLFIKIDSNFNEEWILPYGYTDSLVGAALGVVHVSENEFLGYGYHYADDNTKAVLMRFDPDGNETGYTIIEDEQFNPPTNYNAIQDVKKLNDSTFIAGANFGPQMNGNSNGEYIFTLSGDILKYNSRSGTWGLTMIEETNDGNNLFGTSYMNGSVWDILLYKLNDSLESVPFDTIQYNYDSLCPDTILSGDISLDDCMIITSIDDIPTPEEYTLRKERISIVASPNPAMQRISFILQNTEYHNELQLECYDLLGNRVHISELNYFDKEYHLDISSWSNGIYLAIVRKNRAILGKCKFIIDKLN